MLEEQLRAQREAALRFGFTDEQIERVTNGYTIQTRRRFLTVGSKVAGVEFDDAKRSAELTRARVTARMLLRLLIPNSFMRGRARVRQRKTCERYGTIDI